MIIFLKSLLTLPLVICLIGCSSSSKKKNQYFEVTKVKKTNTVSGRDINYFLYGLEVAGRPDMSVPPIYSRIFIHTCGKTELAYFLESETSPIRIGLLKNKNGEFVSKFKMQTLSINMSSREKYRIRMSPVNFAIGTCYGANGEVISQIPGLVVLEQVGDEYKEDPSHWQIWLKTGEVDTLIQKIPNSDGLYRMIHPSDGKVNPPRDRKSTFLGFEPRYSGKLKRARFLYRIVWVGHHLVDGKEQYTLYDISGNPLSTKTFDQIFSKTHTGFRFYDGKFEEMDVFTLIGIDENGKFSSFSLDLDKDYWAARDFKNLGESPDMQSAAMKIDSYVNASKERILAKQAKHDKNQAFRISQQKFNIDRINAILRGPNFGSSGDWGSIISYCKIFKPSDKLKPDICNTAHSSQRDVEERKEALKKARHQAMTNAINAKAKRESESWNSFLKERGYDKKKSGSSQMIHDQMLRNGYRWIRRKKK